MLPWLFYLVVNNLSHAAISKILSFYKFALFYLYLKFCIQCMIYSKLIKCLKSEAKSIHLQRSYIVASEVWQKHHNEAILRLAYGYLKDTKKGFAVCPLTSQRRAFPFLYLWEAQRRRIFGCIVSIYNIHWQLFSKAYFCIFNI